METEKHVEEDRWPTIKTTNLIRLYNFYIEELAFTSLQDYKNIEKLDRVVVKLNDFCLLLQQSNGNGFVIPDNNNLSDKNLLDKEPVLYIPVPYPFNYFDKIKSRTKAILSSVLSETPYAHYDFDGFYVRDKDGNLLNFFRDYHGPYIATNWDWLWEDRVQERISQLKKSSRLYNELNQILVFSIVAVLVLFVLRKISLLNIIFMTISIYFLHFFIGKLLEKYHSRIGK